MSFLDLFYQLSEQLMNDFQGDVFDWISENTQSTKLVQTSIGLYLHVLYYINILTLPHSLHSYGLVPVWILMCFCLLSRLITWRNASYIKLTNSLKEKINKFTFLQTGHSILSPGSFSFLATSDCNVLISVV